MKKSNINNFENPSELPFSELVTNLHRIENAREFIGQLLAQCGGGEWAIDGLIMLIQVIIKQPELSDVRDYGEDLQNCLYEWTPEHSKYFADYKERIQSGKSYGAEDSAQ